MRSGTPGAEHQERKSRRSGLCAGILFVGGVVFLLRGILLGREVLSDSDVLLYFFPLKSATRDLFHQGASLLWNPLLGEGQPLAANPAHEIFYPATWLLALFSVAPSLAIAQVVHLALSWFGTRRFLKKVGRSEAAALLGASAWTFGGVIASSMHFLPILFAWAWIPWLLSELASSRPSVPRCAFFGAMVLLVGEPMSAVMAILGSLAVLPPAATNWRRILRVLCAAALSAALAAAILLPGWGVARKGVRAAGIPEELSEHKSFPPLRFVELVAPRMTGDTVRHRDRNYLGWRLNPEREWPFFTGIYGGALLIPLLVVGVGAVGRRPNSFIAVAGLSFLLALGRATPLWSILRRLVPPWRMFRYPEKFMALGLFLAIAVACAGFDEAFSSGRIARRLALGLFMTGASFAVVGLLSFGAQGPALDPSRIWGRLPIENAEVFFRGVCLRAAAAYVVFGLLFWRGRAASDGGKRAIAFVTVVAASFDVLSSSRDFIRTHSIAAMNSPPPVVRRLRNISPVPRLVDFLPQNPPVPVAGADEFNGPWDRNRILGEQAVQWGVPLALETDYDLTYFAGSDRARALLSHVASENPHAFSRLLAGRSDGALLVWKTPITLQDPVTVVGAPGLRPEIDSALTWERFAGDDDFLRIVRQRRDDLSRVAFVEKEFPAPPVLAEGRITVRNRRNDVAEFSVVAPSPCLVRIAWTNDGNWKASVDGRLWPVRTVDISLIGLLLPSGRHSVRVWYSDPLMTIGIVISVLAWSCLLVLGLRRTFSGRPVLRRPE